MRQKPALSRSHTSITRRSFVAGSAAGAAGLALSGGGAGLFAAASRPSAKVVVAHDPKVIGADGTIEQPLLQDMLARAMVSFSGEKTAADAWRSYFKPDDIVGLKLNLNSARMLRGSNFLQHFTGLTSAIVSGLESAGVKRSNQVIWERSDEELKAAGYDVQKDEGSLRVMGNREGRRNAGSGIGFSRESFPVGSASSRVSRIVTEVCTAMINIPVLKDHRISGVTGALKNHYGTIHNPRDFHPNQACNPGIAEVNAIPVIRRQERLIIVDALMCVYDGGPRWQRNAMASPGTILVGTDPVAIDTIMLRMLDQERKKNGLESVAPRARFLRLSEELGLGVADPNRIEVVSV